MGLAAYVESFSSSCFRCLSRDTHPTDGLLVFLVFFVRSIRTFLSNTKCHVLSL